MRVLGNYSSCRNVWFFPIVSLITMFAPKLVAFGIILIIRQVAFIGTNVSEGLIGKFSQAFETAVEAQTPISMPGLPSNITGQPGLVYQGTVPTWAIALGS